MICTTSQDSGSQKSSWKIPILTHCMCCCSISFFQIPTCVQTIWQGVERHWTSLTTATFRWTKVLIPTTSCCCSPQSIVLLVWSGRNTAGRKLWQVFSKRLSLFCSLYIFRGFSVSCNCFFPHGSGHMARDDSTVQTVWGTQQKEGIHILKTSKMFPVTVLRMRCTVQQHPSIGANCSEFA